MITWGERPGTAKVSKDSATLNYVLSGVTDRTIAYALAAGYSSVLFGGLFRSDVQVNQIGPDLFHCDISYGPAAKKEPQAGDWSWNFDTTGATKHITHGIAHVATYPTTGAPYDHKGLIGVSSDGVEGVDVPDKAFKWSETHQLLLADYGFTYSTILGQYTGQKNTATFRGFPAGTVRFDGSSGGQSSKDPIIAEYNYNFAVSPDETGLTIGAITGIAKTGWDYLWVRCAEKTDSTLKTTTLTPVQVEVEKVMNSFDFALLGIGTS